MVKNPPASAGAAEGAVLIPELGRSPAPPTPVFLPRESHGQKEPGGLQSRGPQRVEQRLSTHTTQAKPFSAEESRSTWLWRR